ncbi:MAG: NAD(P)H-hydrate dehydratase [Candidatus Gottesmanbacteria bacterium]|nr:NAD(P)H-hydrate dehydratase [Candidatus Gottesmanbacteria bacterium]
MESVTIDDVKKIRLPQRGSHKGQNGRLLVIGGSHLFHAASLWALTVASRIVDLAHYSSVPENNAIVHEEKKEFRNGIVVPRGELGPYIEEDDCILIGPGMTRDAETETITNTLLTKYPDKQWVIDAGSLQMMDCTKIPKHAILTPHHAEFAHAFGSVDVADVAQKYQCIVLLKGEKDIACGIDSSDAAAGVQCRSIAGGNPGMTKGGTGDVLAGLIAALACKNDPFLATIAGSFINKRAGDELYKKVGPYFNATDLANEIPVVMKELLF